MKLLTRIIAGLAFIFFSLPPAFCQVEMEEKIPHYVLVQINSEKNRIDALQKAHRYADVEEVKKDAIGVKKAMMKDFSDHFSYCPVFYYVDTNIELIKSRQFEGILFDTAGRTITNLPIGPTSKDYLIVYYGLPTTQPHKVKVVKDSITEYSQVGVPSGIGLIICNYKLQQLRYIYKLGLAFVMLDKKKKKGYYYVSKHFNIEYFPLAADFNGRVPYIYE
jgi:hypothetical protein